MVASKVNGLFPSPHADDNLHRNRVATPHRKKAKLTTTEASQGGDHTVKDKSGHSRQDASPSHHTSASGHADQQTGKRKIPRVAWICLAGVLLIGVSFGGIRLAQFLSNTPRVISVEATRSIRSSFGIDRPKSKTNVLLVVEISGDTRIPSNRQRVYIEAKGSQYPAVGSGELTSKTETRKVLVFSVPANVNQSYLHIGDYNPVEISFDFVHDELGGLFR